MSEEMVAEATNAISAPDTAWMLVPCALVLLMIPPQPAVALG